MNPWIDALITVLVIVCVYALVMALIGPLPPLDVDDIDEDVPSGGVWYVDDDEDDDDVAPVSR